MRDASLDSTLPRKPEPPVTAILMRGGFVAAAGVSFDIEEHT
jgi:hypothetical protein